MTTGNSVTDELLAELARAAARPLDAAGALPAALYASADMARLEQEHIFARAWLCAGLAAEIPNAGDYLTFVAGLQPVFVRRGEDGAIGGFANVCAHRMAPLLAGRGSCRRIVCPYHAWTYDLDGRLLGAPHMGRSDGFDKRGVALASVRTEIWEGWIYITLDEAAPPLADQLAPLQEMVARYRMAGYVPIAGQDFVWDTNWKILTENFMEGYHLPILHRRTVGAWFPAEETGFPERVFEAFTYQTFTKTADARYGLAHASNTVLEGRWRNTSVMPTVYPTHMYVLAPDHLWYLALMPQGAGQVRVRFGVAVAPEVMAALPDRDAFIKETVEFFDRVNDEDKFIVEGIYRNALSPLARPGRLSWLERELHDFQGYLARKLKPRIRGDERR